MNWKKSAEYVGVKINSGRIEWLFTLLLESFNIIYKNTENREKKTESSTEKSAVE
ncbi:hypothetical protein GCM10007938_22790 [Vibrio zhanjiangensis]|uniref:Uncharacterized protein n=1 Tax=Vibrio zhanjiangensis TaxID=1046128 RepID=A0ABQ6F158_9VIBR|nr:hypothetical protein GCM10007938_22790 [Vibrio zhanjiangensis]